MLETARLDGVSEAIELDFVERVATSGHLMKLGVHLHLAGLSLSNTVSILDSLGVNRARSTVHNWVQKADLKPRGGQSPEKIALDETVIKIDGELFWFFAAVDPDTNRFLHVGLYIQRTIVATEMFLRELAEKHEVGNAEFFVDGAPWLHA